MAFWDALLARHPQLVIDNCASGGRRIDLETSSRSIPLWRTDLSGLDPAGHQCHTYGIHLYLPTSATGSPRPDPYWFRSAVNAGVVLNWNPYLPDFPVETARRLLAEFRRIRPYFLGDYHPLTPYSVEDGVWMAWQFHREDLREGMAMAFRRQGNAEETRRIRMFGLLPEAEYRLTFEDTGERKTVKGEELLSGFTVAIREAPGSFLLTYRQAAEDGG